MDKQYGVLIELGSYKFLKYIGTLEICKSYIIDHNLVNNAEIIKIDISAREGGIYDKYWK